MLPVKQIKLLWIDKNFFNEIINLIKTKKLPNKILLSGQKGIGKSTLAYHIINYIFSKMKSIPYILEKIIN